ncbi:MAG: NAD(P)/FAD-dependent oxidoreductase [Steroidobacteraceae bacterium]
MTQVVIVGAGFAGLNAAKVLANQADIEVTLVDRENHHVFQPLLYQVATAGLSPAEIAAPIRGILSKARNVRVLMATTTHIDPAQRTVATSVGVLHYDYLLLACGATHAYFGHEEWETHAPGLKTLPQATEIRARVLRAFEAAETTDDPVRQREQLSFAIIGGGPTGVELAGAIGEMSRYTLARDFRKIDPRLARIMLIEAGPRILPSFEASLAARAVRDLESLGVQVWTQARVTHIDAGTLQIGNETLRVGTILWAAGVRASPLAAALGNALGVATDNAGRLSVNEVLTVAGDDRLFVLGDLARYTDPHTCKVLPGTADVAMQQGIYAGQCIRNDLRKQTRKPFHYRDWGHLATIGRSRALYEAGKFHLSGYLAWWFWLLLHIYRLSGFRNRASVLVQWAWSYWTYGRGARLIVGREWRTFGESSNDDKSH